MLFFSPYVDKFGIMSIRKGWDANVKESYANVIINNNHRSLDKTFQYLIPAHLANNVLEGSLVLVPFGNTLKYGYVVELSHKKQHPKLKEIKDVLSRSLSLNEEEISLANWMSDYYLTTRIKTLKMFIPVGALPNIIKQFKLLEKAYMDDLNTSAKKLYDIVYKAGDKWIDNNLFENDRKSYKKAYKELLDKGYIIEQHIVLETQRRNNWRDQKAILNVEKLRLENHCSLRKRAPKQWAIVKALQEGFDSSIQSLLDITNVDIGVLKRLIEKDIISIESYKNKENYMDNSICLNSDQKKAYEIVANDIENKSYNPYLLYGITGSGKTEVYMEIMEHCLKKELQTILVLPEIFLTLQIVSRLQSRFSDHIVILHSKLTPKERYEAWKSIKFGQKKIIVGARSVVFAPVKKLGAIIIDEEHDTSYKQDNDPKYNAREVALKRAMWHNCPVVLGSATPSLETFLGTQTGKIKLLSLPKRVKDYQLPTVQVIDMRDELRQGNLSIFSKSLQEEISKTLANKKQIILYLNRRGFASFVLCRDCGFILNCVNCEVSLTYHQTTQKMLCHYCGFSQSIPQKCPECNSLHWKPFGLGTQKIEHEFKTLYPHVDVMRIDGDISDKKEVVQNYLDEFAKGKTNVLIGTQMVAKGLDFPNVTLVGVIAADTTLNLPDFRSREKSFQLLTQVAGRAGRGKWEGKVVIQTFNPHDISIVHAKNQDFTSFYKDEITFRKEYNYPPFSQIIRIVFTGRTEDLVNEGANFFYKYFTRSLQLKKNTNFLQILGPNPCGLVKIKGEYRYQLLVKYEKGVNLRPIVKVCLDEFYQASPFANKVNVSLDISPNNFA
ncbi:MAG: hypothetical protein APF76_05245 [Desulfitibacter sp. BRH_c19]|nr:MAG: hypothetical protein APF76_05245 [Desulfitibacter sp. BRH_c19]